MYLIKKRYLNFIFTFFTLILLVIVALFYVILNYVDFNSEIQIKLYSERLVFAGILFAIVISAIYIIAVYKNIKVLKKLDKLIELSKYGNYEFKKELSKLGALGERIQTLFKQTTFMSEKKSFKISSMANLNNFLFENIDLNLVVCDVEGMIVNCSLSFYKKFKTEASEVLYRNINDFKILNFKEAVFDIDKSKQPIIYKRVVMKLDDAEYKIDVTCAPILNLKNELSNVVLQIE
ncbi:MAG TPA: hypothetical protein PLG34_04710 [Spirochaetota bacterium]|nr:MAG: hypothetical protein BWX91_01562 [Spirochaetes bacterium ADurb.Bin133]HNZ27728.1 hypothetical protein [Spirochaetota bacterium]HPY87263.1 hypothetical protein [Spirochaetota bacterium]HQB61027.1 hypothetical protein [Spirochaetota bacterium]